MALETSSILTNFSASSPLMSLNPRSEVIFSMALLNPFHSALICLLS
jgi:hypothetical protein